MNTAESKRTVARGMGSKIQAFLTAKEMHLAICSMPRKSPIDVFYTWYEGKPQSQRLEFRKGERTKFEIFLPHYGEDLVQLCSALEDRKTGGTRLPGFWTRLFLRLIAGTPVSCQDLFPGPNSDLKTPFGDARVSYKYRLAWCRKGLQESVVLVSSRHGQQSSTFRREQRMELNWITLSLEESQILLEHLRSFISNTDFGNLT